MPRVKYLLVLSLLLFACSDGSDDRPDIVEPEPPLPDFSAVDAWLEEFVAAQEQYPGSSIAIVDENRGIIHKRAFGDQDEETVVLLASLSKVPSVMLELALNEDDAKVDFDIQAPIANYLPWEGVWDPAITTEHLLSNRSGIPGLQYFLTQPVEYLPHICQGNPADTLSGCAETIFTTPLPNLPSNPANTAFDYGGSQWQLSGGVAESVGGGTWNQLWDQYVAQPCGLELARFGNNVTESASWDGNPDSLIGLENPNIEGGMIANLDDYAKLLSLHLNDGACGDNQVLSPESVASMREQRTSAGAGDSGYIQIWGYGMGWWVNPPEEGGSIYLYLDPGFYGSLSWIDVERGYGAVVFFEDYTSTDGGATSVLAVFAELIPIIEEAFDAVR